MGTSSSHFWSRAVIGTAVAAAVAAAIVLTGCQPITTFLTVTTTADGRDAQPGDGVCETAAGAGDCTLRAAMDEAAAGGAGIVTITLPSGSYALTLPGVEDGNAGGDLDLAGPVDLTIDGADPGGAEIVASGAEGGIDLRAGTLRLVDVGVRGAAGAGLRVTNGTTALVERASLHANGTGLEVAAGGVAYVGASTLAGNTGAGSTVNGALHAGFTTVTANGGGGLAGAGTAELRASIVAGQVAGADCDNALAVTSLGANLASDGTCPLPGAGDVASAAPQLGALSADVVPAAAPLPGSPALDAVPAGTDPCGAGVGAIDQLQSPRPLGAGCERGAVEATGGLDLVVNDGTDLVDAVPGDGVCATAGGSCTLRAAISEVNATPLPAVSHVRLAVDVTLTRAGANEDADVVGDLDLLRPVVIDGGGHTVAAGAGLGDRLLHLPGASSDVVLRDLELVGGLAAAWAPGGSVAAGPGASARLEGVTVRGGAGRAIAVAAGASMTLTDSVVADNTGGGVESSGDLTVDRSTFRGNSGGDPGEAIVARTGSHTTLRRSTFTANVGRAVVRFEGSSYEDPEYGTITRSPAVFDILSSTFVGNPGTFDADAALVSVDNADGTIRSSTLVARLGAVVDDGAAGSPFSFSSVQVDGSILSSATGVCRSPGSITSTGWNLSSDSTCMLLAAGDRMGVEPVLAPLGSYGGGTATAIPRAGSPAVDAIPPGTTALCDIGTTLDQRGFGRPVGAGCDVGAVEGAGAALAPATFVVDTAADAPDATVDGTCAIAGGGCSLRAALREANVRPTPDTIVIAAGIDPVLSVPGVGEEGTAAGDLDVTGSVTIEGGGATIDARGIDRAFQVRSGTLRLHDVRVTGGRATTPTPDGGAIAATSPVVLDHARLDGNHADGSGGAVALLGWAALTADASTIADNTANRGAVATTNGYLGAGPITLRTSTVSGNEALDDAAIHADAGLVIDNSTVSGNRSTGPSTNRVAISVVHGPLRIDRATITGNVAPHLFDVSAFGAGTVQGSILDAPLGSELCDQLPTAVSSLGFNLLRETSCGFRGPGDQVGSAPRLGPLADNGGPTPTHLLLAGSPAADAIAPGAPFLCDASTPVDQRGATRPAGAGCDIGSTEGIGTPPPPLDLHVTSAVDGIDALPGDGSCADAVGSCTLRAAVNEANAWPGADTITIDAGVDPTLSLAGAGEDGATTGDLDIADALTIEGQGATVSGADLDRVFESPGPRLRLRDLTIEHGTAVGKGGLIRTTGDLDLLRVELRNGAALGSGFNGQGYGGAIAVEAEGRLDLVDASVHDNNSEQGIAIFQEGSGGGLVDRTTIWDNQGFGLWSSADVHRSTITGNGGGILYARAVESSTIAGNAGSAVAQIQSARGSIIDASTGVRTCNVAFISLGYNLLTEDYCGGGAGHGTDRVHAARLGPLADNGGLTPTRINYVNSDAVDAIPAGTEGLCDAGATDQRGTARPAGAGCDIGAVEGARPVSAPLALTVDSAVDASDAAPGDGSCATAAGACTLRAAVQETNAWPAADEITIGVGVDPVLSIGGAAENAAATGDLDVLDDLSIHGGGATVDADRVDRVLDVRGVQLAVDHVTITGGSVAWSVADYEARGGGIRTTGGPLSLDTVDVVGNESTDSGGGVSTRAGLAITASHIDRNTSRDYGGGVDAVGGSVAIDHTTISGNALSTDCCQYGGGLAIRNAGPSTLDAVTIAGNTASDTSALFVERADLVVTRSTIDAAATPGRHLVRSYHDAGSQLELRSSTIDGGSSVALFVTGPPTPIVLAGSIVAGTGTACVHESFGTPATSGGFNVVDDASCALAGAGDVQAAALLGPLADHGGATPTRLPGAGSPARDAIAAGTAGWCDGTTPADQRGVTRPQGPACDIGATEQ